jgi:hypothetical protein
MSDRDRMVYELEDMIDKSSLGDVLEMLVEICYEKADHLRHNWQDEAAAKQWERWGKKIDRIVL